MTYVQNRKGVTDLENELMVTRGRYVMDMYTLLYLKWITNKDLPYSTWNSAVFCGPEGSLGENGYMYMYG